MSWLTITFSVLARRWWLLLLLAGVTALGVAVERGVSPLLLPTPSEPVVWLLVVWSSNLLVWRAADERRGRRARADAQRAWELTGHRLLSRLDAFVIPNLESERREVDHVKSDIRRRHGAIHAAVLAVAEGREPASDSAVLGATTPEERREFSGLVLIEYLTALQRRDLVECDRRRWLSSGRFTTIEDDMSVFTVPPAPSRTWSSGFTRLASLTVSVTALLLPMTVPPRLGALALAAGFSALLVAFDALSDA
jgi:hypothetical protein